VFDVMFALGLMPAREQITAATNGESFRTQ
jgi:hypothetical protein